MEHVRRIILALIGFYLSVTTAFSPPWGKAFVERSHISSTSDDSSPIPASSVIDENNRESSSSWPLEQDESKYEEVRDATSNVPFRVDTNKGPVFYYLRAKCDGKRISQITGELHNCIHCKSRMKKHGGYFGPEGYAVDFGGVAQAGRLFSKIELERPSLTGGDVELASTGPFIVSQENLDHFPRVKGEDPESGEPFTHIGLNIPVDSAYMTDSELAKTITPLLNSMGGDLMDGLLRGIITVLQKRDDVSGESDFEIIKRVATRDEVLRKQFWGYRFQAIEDIQKYAAQFDHGNTDWDLMSQVDKMQMRIYVALFGASYAENGDNPTVRATRAIVDIAEQAHDINAIPGLMNARSDPNSYMVQQIASKNLEKSVNAPFVVSLSWESRTDLDGHILTDSEHIFYGNRRSKDGQVYLNFDANGGGPPTKQPVETFTLSSQHPRKYTFAVNNYCTRDGDKAIPFTVLVNLAGETQTFRDGWDCRVRCDNPENTLHRMIKVCEVEITQEMIDLLNLAPEGLSLKQANRMKHLLPEFKEKFGKISTSIANMSLLDGHVLTGIAQGHDGDLGAEAKLSALEGLVHSALTDKKTGKETLGSRSSSGLNTLDDIVRSLRADPGSIKVSIRGRDYYPSTITTHSCSDQLKTNTIVNSYIEEGKPPVQPNPSTRENCRFEKEWSDDFSGELLGTAIFAVKNMFYDGFFLSLANTQLPSKENTQWCVGGGMYPTDLLAGNYKFREVWATLHPSVRPCVGPDNIVPAIGVFLHRGKTYPMIVNGISKTVAA